jgi:ribosomal protein L37AE/L43A
LNTKYSETEIHQFIKEYVKSKNGIITDLSDEVFSIKYPRETNSKEYTYQPNLAREKKIPLITTGSLAFQQILKDCLENGVLCQISLKPKKEIDTLLKGYFKDSPVSCEGCDEVVVKGEVFSSCIKSPPCYHQINNGKIVSVKLVKNEPVRYFQFYFSATFLNKLRPKNEEIITVLMDEECKVVSAGDLGEKSLIKNDDIEIQDFKTKLEPAVFDKLKTVADEKIMTILKEKIVLFDLTLNKEKKSKLRSFDKRLRRERREKIISRKHDFDLPQWRTNYELLLSREEESFITNIAVKLINLIVINTTKIKFELNLDNNSTIRSSSIIGINHNSEVSCPVCKKTFYEGYATQDALYVCKKCIKQSVDTAKIYSKKAALSLDETLNEYFEHDSGFICSVCGKRHSLLLEFKCSHDNSSVCILHYGFCDVCGKVFSKLNLTYTDEFKRQLCPKHSAKNKVKAH